MCIRDSGNGTAFDVADAIQAAVLQGADVVNLSLSFSSPSQAVEEALGVALGSGLDVFAAAGNTGALGVAFPASVPGVMAVAAVDGDDVKAPFSAYGPGVDLCAPGVDVYGAMPDGGAAWWSGTSMATAVASGSGSLLRSLGEDEGEGDDGDDSGDGVPLLDTCDDVDGVNPAYAGLLGAGRINLYDGAEDVAD